MRAIAFILALALLTTAAASGAAPSPSSPSIAPGWRAEVASLLSRRARAVVEGNRGVFDETMAGAPALFRLHKGLWFERLRPLPLGSYSLELSEDDYEDLAPALAGRIVADEVHVVHAIERLAFARYDERPTSEDLYLTVVRRGARWSVIDDDGLDRLGLLSARNLWDFADVRRLERGGVMVLYQSGRTTAERILTATIGAVARTRRAWPYPWRGRVVVVIPESSRQLSRILQTTFDLGPFVAFAGSSVERAGGGYRLVGHRVFVQPDTFFDTSRAYQEETLGHELLHVASRSQTGAFTPAWLEEGVAQLYGERAVPGIPELARRVRAGTFERRLPEDYQFAIGTRADIQLSYQASAHFTGYLRERFGPAAGARLYRAVGREQPVSFGTGRYHLDRAARRAFGSSLRDLERAWSRRLAKNPGDREIG